MTMSKNSGLGLGWAATLGAFAAPLAVMLWQVTSSLFDGAGVSVSLGPIFLIGYPISLLATWLLGLPLVLCIRRRKSLNAVAVCLGGIVIGAILFVTLLWLVELSSQATAHVFGQALVGGILGLLVASFFCLLARIPFRANLATTPL